MTNGPLVYFSWAVQLRKVHQKKKDIFNIFALNIDCGYTLEPPRRGVSNEYLQSVFDQTN